jgi:D-xylulose reductase
MTKFGLGERGEGVNLIVECSGAETCVQTGICLLKRRGDYVQVGAGPADNLIPMSILVNK